MKRQKKKLHSVFLSLLLVLLLIIMLLPTSSAAEIDPEVAAAIESQGSAEVIVFVDAPLSEETQVLLNQQEYISGQDMQVLKKALKEKKKNIQKQQQNVLRQMNVVESTSTEVSPTTLESEDIDLVLEEKYSYINAFSGTLTREGYEKLVRDEQVTGIYKNEEVKLLLDTATGFVTAPFAQTISLNGSTINGSGIGICVIDTGVDTTHPSLQGTIVDQYCYCSQGTGCCPNGKTEDTSAADDNGHGTAVIGTIASQDPSYPGVAPGAQVMVVKAFSSTGSATTGDVLSGIVKCLEKASTHNIKVFSFSFGGTTYSSTCDVDPLASVANELVDLGFFVSAASGNSGESAKISSPACGTNVTAVGAVYDNGSTVPDTVPSFSNANGALDLLAPGVGICTTSINGKSSSSCASKKSGVSEETAGKNFGQYSGTSFSAPMVAGAAALVAQYKQEEANTVLSPLTINDVLTQYGTSVLDSRNGKYFPRLNIENTLRNIDAAAPEIIFAAETPVDGATIEKGATVNISINASDAVNNVSNCIINYNGSNTSMAMVSSGRTAQCSAQIIAAASSDYTIYAEDANGNSETVTRSFVVSSNPPVIDSYNPESTALALIIPETQLFMITATDSDNDALTYTWKVDGTEVGTSTEYEFDSEEYEVGTHTIIAQVHDDVSTTEQIWNVSVTERHAPTVTNVTITPQEAYRNASLVCAYEYSDADNDPENGTSVVWYKNNELQNISNTTIPVELLVVDDFWNCSVTPSDGVLEGEVAISSARVIQNGVPALSITGTTTVYETENIVLTIEAEDSDGDSITVALNDSQFTQNGTNYTLQTTLSSAGIYTLSVTAADAYDTTTEQFSYTVTNAEDTDGDGIPDFKDDDDDNDGILDTEDKIQGTPTLMNYANFTIEINGSINTTGNFTEVLPVSLLLDETTNMTFFHNFSESNLILSAVVFENANTSEGNILIHNLTTVNKTIIIPDRNASTTAVCVYDVVDPTMQAITSACNGTAQYLVPCNGTITNGYSCTDSGTTYIITGLQHSGVLEMCVDNDSDGYGTGCVLGTDCNDNNAAVSPAATEIADNGIDDNCDGTAYATPVQQPVEEEEPAAAGGGGGGGGPGPTTSDEGTEAAGEATSAVTAETQAENAETKQETTAEETASLDAQAAEQTNEAGGTEQANSVFALTGAVVTDILNGNVSYGFVGSIMIGIFVFGGLIFGASRMFRKKKTKATTAVKEQLTDIYEGIKDLFR
ncbi:S8 family serine peptidase [Candidatus Woesearchaeota archaeon]|nr:S8 family serine peptidase [Candidatus Woesearchaeota archaeon]